MSDQKANDPAVPLFDVVVTVPSGRKLEDVDRLAREAGIQPERVAALVNALRSVPQAKIGAGVTRERADKAKEQFTAAGLNVEVTPVLALGALVTGSFDGMQVCPACNTRVMLPTNRQCPSCGVFVDKVTDEVLLKRKIMEQEKGRIDFQTARDAQESEKKIRDALEASLRAQVRAELEAKYGVHGKSLFGGKAGAARVAGLAVLLGVSFLGGKAISLPEGSRDWKNLVSFGPDKGAAKPGSPGDVGKMLDSVGPKGGAGPAGGAASADMAAAGTTGDADIDDPLIQAAGGKRIGKKGLTIEQAVAASQTLAKAVGNNTAERALAGAGSAGPAAGGAADVASAQGTAVQGAGPAQDGVAAPSSAAVPAQTKLLLSAEFARQLSEMGQAPRAAGIITALKASPGLQAEPAAAAAVRITDIEIKAWAMQSLAEGRARQAADALMAQAKGLPNDVERATALARAGAILGRNAQLPPEAARAFLTEAAESMKAVADPAQRNAVASTWSVALGQVLLAHVAKNARSGAWNKARAAGGQIEELVKHAPDSDALMRLHAIDHQARQQLGQGDKAAQSLDAALALAGKTASLPERAAQLRVISQLSEAGAGERMQAALAALQSQAAAKGGMERARTLASLALLHGEAGLRGKAAEVTELARATSGLSPADAVAINTDLIVRGDLAAARLLHTVGLYAEAEVVLQRVGGYLL